MTWAALGTAFLKAFGALFGWLDRKQLLDAGRAAAKGEGDAQALRDVSEIQRLRSDPTERERVRELLNAAAEGHPLRKP